MSTCLRSAHSPFSICHSVLCVMLLGLSPGGCINKGDTNIGRGDEVTSRTNDENEDEDAGVVATGVNPAGTEGDSAQTDNTEPAHVSDDTAEPSASDSVTPVSPVGSGGSSSAEGGAGATEVSAGGGGATAGSANGGSAGATVDEAAPCAGVDIPVSVSAGRYSTCGITPNGTVRCWGSNAEGQLGTGDATSSSSSIPLSVPGLCARHVVVGSDHACAIDLEGGVWCWGLNMYGQLGNARNSKSWLPSEVEITNVKQLAAGESHTCALTEDGAIQCWGYNGNGQLGDSTTEESNVPVHVDGLGGTVVQITAGRWHTCALLEGGTAQCWGYGASGQLGIGMVTDTAVTPLDVLDLADATQISAGYEHVCARLEGGTVKCWGTTPSTPFFGDGVVGEIAGVSAASVASGGTFTCALNTNAGVVCWGTNDRGQIGMGSLQQPAYESPQELVGSTGEAIAVTLGYEHGCVVLPDNVVKCWGRGDSGQLGTGTMADSSTPTKLQLFLP